MFDVVLGDARGGHQTRTSSIIVYDQYSNVVAIVFESAEGVIHLARITDHNFDKICAAFGIDKIAVVQKLDLMTDDLPPGARRLT